MVEETTESRRSGERWTRVVGSRFMVSWSLSGTRGLDDFTVSDREDLNEWEGKGKDGYLWCYLQDRTARGERKTETG